MTDKVRLEVFEMMHFLKRSSDPAAENIVFDRKRDEAG
jgi:hypothetical protein